MAISLESGHKHTLALTGLEDIAGNHVDTDREVVLTVQRECTQKGRRACRPAAFGSRFWENKWAD